MRQVAEKDQLLDANRLKEKKQAVRAELLVVKCCQSCAIARPSKYSEAKNRDTWYQGNCGFCGALARRKFQDARRTFDSKPLGFQSLRLRINDELSHADQHIPSEFKRSSYMRKKKLGRIDAARQYCADASAGLGPKFSLRAGGREDVSLHVLAGALQRTRARLTAEPELSLHAGAYGDLLELLGVE